MPRASTRWQRWRAPLRPATFAQPTLQTRPCALKQALPAILPIELNANWRVADDPLQWLLQRRRKYDWLSRRFPTDRKTRRHHQEGLLLGVKQK